MQTGFLWPVVSQETLHFAGALALNAASPVTNLPLPPAVAKQRIVIRALSVVSVQNLGWELNFFGSASGVTADPQTDRFLSMWAFTAAMGTQFGGAGLWRYYVDGLAIPYVDRDTVDGALPGTLHVVLVNRGAGAKLAGAPGQLVVTGWVEPTGTW